VRRRGRGSVLILRWWRKSFDEFFTGPADLFEIDDLRDETEDSEDEPPDRRISPQVRRRLFGYSQDLKGGQPGQYLEHMISANWDGLKVEYVPKEEVLLMVGEEFVDDVEDAEESIHRAGGRDLFWDGVQILAETRLGIQEMDDDFARVEVEAEDPIGTADLVRDDGGFGEKFGP